MFITVAEKAFFRSDGVIVLLTVTEFLEVGKNVKSDHKVTNLKELLSCRL